MQPGISRAVSMGIIGFLAGGLLVFSVRGLQSLDPIWDVGPGIVFSVLFAAAFFLWGIGAFDPRLSVHGEHVEAAPEPEAEEGKEEPRAILSAYIWKISFVTLVVLLVLGLFATLPGGPAIRTVGDPLGNAAAIGYHTLQLPFGGPVIEVSELVLFVAFAIFTLLSLAVAAGIIGLLFYLLSRGVHETVGAAPIEARTPPRPVQLIGRGAGRLARAIRSGLPRFLGQK